MIPICIQTIENDDDRDFMEWLFLEYHPLMYATIRKVIHDQWTCEDVLLEDKYVLNMSDAEIASALGVKPSSVRMLLTRARSKARKAIEKKM